MDRHVHSFSSSPTQGTRTRVRTRAHTHTHTPSHICSFLRSREDKEGRWEGMGATGQQAPNGLEVGDVLLKRQDRKGSGLGADGREECGR